MEGYIFTNNLHIVAWHKSPWHMFRSASYSGLGLGLGQELRP